MMLKVKNVRKNFGGVRALDNCSLEIEKEKITAIIGPNGSGKSTLFNVISKLVEIDKGKILINKKNTLNLKDFEIANQGLSRTFQEVRLFSNLTIQDHIEIALSTNDESFLNSFFRNKEETRKKVKDILDLVCLNKPLKTYATDLSYGQRKLLDLAVAIAKPHDILLLDEPVAGVNPKLRHEIKKIIKKLNKKGATILLIEHDMNFVMDLVNYIFVMDAGNVIAKGKPKQIQNNKKVLDAYLGE